MAENKIKVDFEEETRDPFGGVPDAPDTGLIDDNRPSWLGYAPGLTDADVTAVHECDVLVLGAGIAGISAARAAAFSLLVATEARIGFLFILSSAARSFAQIPLSN